MSSQDEEKSSTETKATLRTDEHLIKLDDLVLKLNTNIEEGLTTKQASKMLDKDGPNELSTPQKESLLGIFLKNQFGGFLLIFWIAGAFCFLLALGIKSYVKEGSFFYFYSILLGEYYLILYLGITRCVLYLAGIYSFYQEYKADETMEKVKNMIPLRAIVLRDGKWKDIEASQLVKGDIVEIKQGDKVPADLRIIEAEMLKVDLSRLTGESVAVSLDPKKLNEDAAESKNVAFCSTNITEGFGKGIVTQTGDQTRIGSISKHKQEETTTNTEIQNFIHLTALVMFLDFAVFANFNS